MYPLIIPSGGPPPGGLGASILECREVLGRELGWWGAYTVLAPPSGTPDASSLVLLAELQDDEEEGDRLSGSYAYVRTGRQAGAQRRTFRTSYQGYHGALRATRQFGAPLEGNAIVELSRPLPVKRHLDRKGLADLVGEALARIVIEARLPLEGNGTRSISLAAYPWLLDADQTLGIYDGASVPTSATGSSTAPLTRSGYAYKLRTDGARVSLETAYAYGAGQPFELAVMVPADRLLYDGTDWAYFPTGVIGTIAEDDWRVACPVAWVRTIGMVKALQHLIDLGAEDLRRLGEGLDLDTSMAERATDDVGSAAAESRALQGTRARKAAALERRVEGYRERMPTYEVGAWLIASRGFPRQTIDPGQPPLAVISGSRGGGWSP